MNIFLISNSYIETTLSYNLDYLLKQKIDNIFLLSENHSVSELLIKNSPIKIKLFNNLDEAIIASDMIINIPFEDMSLSLTDKLIKSSNKYNKKLNIYDFPIQKQKIDIDIDRTLNYSNVPVLVLLSIGNYHQMHNTEILINKMFSEFNLNLYQKFSHSSSTLINSIKKETEKNERYDIITLSFEFNDIEEIFNNSDLYELFDIINPDYFVVNVESDYLHVEEIKKMFFYRYNIDVGLFLMSNFISIEKDGYMRPLYYISKKNDNIYFCSDKNIYEIVRRKILSKIALPQDIILL